MYLSRNLKLLELRNYLLKPGMRENFIEYFESHFLDSQFALRGFVPGQFRLKDEPDRFFWMRGFEDMRSRLAFLRGFYEEGAVWKKRGAGANEMMLESDDVYLLKPLSAEDFNCNDLVAENGFFAIDFYFAKTGLLDNLADFYQEYLAPLLTGKPTLWISETAENEFLRHPIIQDPDLFVVITGFENESEYQRQIKRITQIRIVLQEFLTRERNLIIYPTAKSLTGGHRLNSDAPAEQRTIKSSIRVKNDNYVRK